jgi:hypothetical protein
MTKETELRVLSDAELDRVHGGKITEQTLNPQGHIVSNNSNGKPMTDQNVNPQGKPPPGQN